MNFSRPSIDRQPRTIRAFACALLALIAFAAPALAQERARDFIEPHISRTQFAQFCKRVGLAADQQQIANISFTDYETTLNDLTKDLDNQALVVGRQKVDDSLSGKARMAPDELKTLRADVLRVYLAAGPKVDAASDALIGGVEVLITSDQTLKFETAKRWLNREILLHPRASGATYQDYAGDGVDVLEMVDDAKAEGGELAKLPADALNAILNKYEDQLDVVLVETSSANRQGALVRKIAGIEKDTDTLKREEAAALARWQRLYNLNLQTVTAIADAATAALGAPNAGQAFKQRFDHASFVWLYPRKKPDRQIEWLRQQTSLAPDVEARAEVVYADYLHKRDALSRAAIDLMLKARTEFQTFLNSMMDSTTVDDRVKTSLYTDLLKNTGDQSNLESTTTSAIEGLLDDQTRQALRDAMKKPDRPMRAPGAASNR